ncbi:MAG: UrcA family protein [Rhizomicrobium sp.]
MDESFFSLQAKRLLLAALGGLVGGMIVAGDSAIAQPIEVITVTAPYVLHHQPAGRSYTGVPIEVISLTRRVGYSDLDLTTVSGVTELKRRINDTAKDACKQLDTLYPEALYPPLTPKVDCVETAVDGAMAQANVAIAAAHK